MGPQVVSHVVEAFSKVTLRREHFLDLLHQMSVLLARLTLELQDGDKNGCKRTDYGADNGCVHVDDTRTTVVAIWVTAG